MKIKKIKSKRSIIAILCVILILSCLGAFYILNSHKNKPSDGNQAPTPDRSETDIQQSKDLQSQPANKEGRNNTDAPAPITTDQDSGKAVVQMVASSDISNGMVYIRGGINNSVEYDGACFAELISPDGETIRKDTSLLQNSATTDCKTISIPLSDLSPGQWKFTLNYISNSKTGKSNEGSFDI